MHLPRRGFFQAGFAFISTAFTARLSAAYRRPILGGAGQDRSHSPVHPPDPSGYELGTPPPAGHVSAHRLSADNPQRDIAFRNGLDQLLSSATRLRERLNVAPLSEILSVQVYRETQAMERLVKQLKNLAKS